MNNAEGRFIDNASSRVAMEKADNIFQRLRDNLRVFDHAESAEFVLSLSIGSVAEGTTTL